MIRLFFALAIIMSAVPAYAQERNDAGAPGAPPAREMPQREEPVHNSISPLMERVERQKQTLTKNAAQMREILILADTGQRREITATLEELDLEALQDYSLRALDRVLIVTKADQSAFNALRQALPEAEIDWNDDLSASGPRLYAKEKVKWPDKGACLNKALKIPIGIIDGSIDQSHPAFVGQTITEKSFLDHVAADRDHATAIASIIIGNAPDQGFDGLLKGTKIFNAVALRHAPNGEQLATIDATLRGLDWLLGKDIRLINVSLAGKKNNVLNKGFEEATKHGALIFAAAGNNGASAPPVYPAAIDGVFAVSAIDASGRTYKQANTGPYIDFFAPGVDIWVAVPDDGGAYKSGTSYATPYAVAASALQLSNNPKLSGALLGKTIGANIIAKCP